MKEICLNVVLYIIVAILLFYSGISYWKQGRKSIAALTFIVAILTIWQGYENAKEIKII